MRQILVTLEDVKKDDTNKIARNEKPVCVENSSEAMVKIRRIDKSLPLPKYHTAGSVGFDLYCREECVINPREIKLVGVNVNIETPAGYMLAVLPRSSTPRKKGLFIPNGFGVIDQDFCGNEDEVLIQFCNISNELVKIEKGERLAQGVFVKISKFDWNEVNNMENKNRGGVGSTDKKTEKNSDDLQEMEEFLCALGQDEGLRNAPIEDLDF